MKTKLISIFFLLFTLSYISVCLADQITISQTIQDIPVNIDSDGFAEFDLYDAQYLGVTGDPNLPYRIIHVLLPPEAILSTVKTSITKEEFSDVDGSWNVRPVPPPATWDGSDVIVEWPDDKPIVNGENTDIYNMNSAYPFDLISNSTSGQIREWQLVEIPVVLFQYYPSVHQLSRLKSVEIVVNYEVSKSRSSRLLKNGISLDFIGEKRIKKLAVNFDEIAPEYYKYTSDLRNRSSNPTGSYVIITTKSISSSSLELDNFIQNKKLRGLTVHLVTEETWGGGTGNAASDNIRSWLKQNYINLNIEYVLLIGNPDPESGDVPMKMLWPRNNSDYYITHKESPSDYYYSDLTGNS